MSTERDQIVVYTEAVGRGGAEVSLRNLIASLSDAYDVTVMGVDEEICTWIASARPGSTIVAVRPVESKRSVGAFLELRRAIRAARPDVFHVNLRTIADAQYAVAAAVSIRGLRVVVVEQLPFAPTSGSQRRLKRLTSRRLAAHVAVGVRAARQVEEAVGLPPESVGTIYNGVPDQPVNRVAGVRGTLTVGCLARLDRIKGLDLLLDAVAALPDVGVLLVGEGAERDALTTRACELGIADRVEIAAWDDRARERLGELDAFVLPSYNEGFPLSVVEAMLAGLPVVATDVGSTSEAVLDGVTGFVVQPGDVAAIRDAVARLRDSPELRSRFGDEGRRRALEFFTADVMARAFERLYHAG
jgi:glycosyltransferase involved in cell wall biosynthesis